MITSITVRDIDPGDKFWLRREARQTGKSMEELVRRLIHEKRTKTERRPKLSEALARYFVEKHGVGLPPRVRCSYKALSIDLGNSGSPRLVSALAGPGCCR
ncbi:MAG: hypothetical protein OXE76_07995 [Alphaproteobacteria bacterium]|nr:hypothetical protein [Alphaproteobacteria bacterium]MCY4319114.1 hypothetical protein [Alphaproteobacteria bacterium]